MEFSYLTGYILVSHLSDFCLQSNHLAQVKTK